MHKEIFENNNYYIYFPGTEEYKISSNSTVIFCGLDSQFIMKADELSSLIYKQRLNCLIVFYEISNWNDELSPWEYESPDKKFIFKGMAESTFARIMNFKNHFEKEFDFSPSKFLLCGYSLCGLFSLWCLSKTNSFQGAISCSGSLWYPGWIEYLNDNINSYKNKYIYLSLGKKEANSNNAVMGSVGNNTNVTFDMISKINQLEEYKPILEYNNGGHFTNQTERIVAGIVELAKCTKNDCLHSIVLDAPMSL
ncbi:MAG: hypothetical protein ACI4E1_07155 [Lachnospira sp.]